jgi:hypothetical protein
LAAEVNIFLFSREYLTELLIEYGCEEDNEDDLIEVEYRTTALVLYPLIGY